MPNNYKVWYENDNCPDEKWEYIITANSWLDAKWDGIIKAKKDGHLTGWPEVYCELVEADEQ